MSKLYLAYGSNLNKSQMRYRCPGARPLGKLMLQDACLVFRGVADVMYQPGATVPVGVWRIDDYSERALDRYEGVSNGFYVKEYVELSNGQKALIYLMQAEGVMPPSEYYARALVEGYKDFGLPLSYLEAAIKQSWERKDPCPQTQARRAKQRVSTNHQKLAAALPEELAAKRIERIGKNA